VPGVHPSGWQSGGIPIAAATAVLSEMAAWSAAAAGNAAELSADEAMIRKARRYLR